MLKNCRSVRIANNWACVKSCRDLLTEYGESACWPMVSVFLANATGDLVKTGRTGIVDSFPCATVILSVICTYRHDLLEKFSGFYRAR